MYQVQKQSPPPIICLFIVKWKLEKSGIQDIIIIVIASLTMMHNKKAYIPFFRHLVFFSCVWSLYLNSPFQLFRKIQCFQRDNLRSGFSGIFLPHKNWRQILRWFSTQYLKCLFPLCFTSVRPLWECWKLTRSSNFLYQIFLWYRFFDGTFPSLSFGISEFVILPSHFCSYLS